ncbi:MAG: hypothetical protein KDD70_03795 [Bdellovibrionales bacterium]|nr:hypothetical protein [Bdellovibrionales bacterium]
MVKIGNQAGKKSPKAGGQQQGDNMIRYFIPFNGTDPAAVNINGHKLLVISSDRLDVEECLAMFGADTVKSIEGDGGKEDCFDALEELADTIKGDVVIAPEDATVEEILSNLEEELPWLQ